MQEIQILDVSAHSRFGVKGAKAQAWLNQQGITTPELANSWLEHGQDLLVMRLGQSEFLVESQQNSQALATLLQASQTKTSGCYVVARADASFKLSGKNVSQLLARVCRLNLAQELHENKLLMTQVAGVSSILLKSTTTHEASYRVWCDWSYQAYMLNTLSELAAQIATASTD